MSKPAPPPSPRPASPILWPFRHLTLVFMLVFMAGAGLFAYQVARSRVAAEVYRERLVELNDDYEELADHYNKAVTKTAVTELVVADGKITVNIRTADGQLDAIPVAADPTSPVYVDYVVVNGRLLIRQVFDSKTSPDDATKIDSKLIDIDWNDPAVRTGKAVYRQLSDGRWIVTVSGDGSLALAKVQNGTEVQLIPAPEVGEFDPITQTRQKIDRIGPGEVFDHMFGAGVER